MENFNVRKAGVRLTAAAAMLAALSGCGTEKPPLGIFFWRVAAEQIHMMSDNEIYAIAVDQATRTFNLTRHSEKKQQWVRNINVPLDPQDSDISDNVSLVVTGGNTALRQISVLVKLPEAVYIAVLDEDGNLLQQVSQARLRNAMVSQVFDEDGSNLYLMMNSWDGIESHLTIYELENSALVQRYQLDGTVQSPVLQVESGEAVLRVSGKRLIGLDASWQQRWQAVAPAESTYAESFLLGTHSAVIAQGYPAPGINIIDQTTGHISFLPTARIPNVIALGADGNPYILESGRDQVLKQVDGSGQVLFQSATTYGGSSSYDGIRAVKELPSGERVVVSFRDMNEDPFILVGRSTIDWLNPDGTKEQSFTAAGTIHNVMGPDCLFCSASNDRPGYSLTNVLVASDGDVFASGYYSLMTRLSPDSALWDSVSFFGKIDPTKADPSARNNL